MTSGEIFIPLCVLPQWPTLFEGGVYGRYILWNNWSRTSSAYKIMSADVHINWLSSISKLGTGIGQRPYIRETMHSALNL